MEARIEEPSLMIATNFYRMPPENIAILEPEVKTSLLINRDRFQLHFYRHELSLGHGLLAFVEPAFVLHCEQCSSRNFAGLTSQHLPLSPFFSSSDNC